MGYLENDFKFALVVNKSSSSSIFMNAVSHVCLGLGHVEGDADFLNYENNDSGYSAIISRYPVIVLAAKNSNQISRFVGMAIEAQLNTNYFTEQMIAASSDEQMENNRNTGWGDLKFVCASVFGYKDIVDPLTKRFSLFT